MPSGASPKAASGAASVGAASASAAWPSSAAATFESSRICRREPHAARLGAGRPGCGAAGRERRRREKGNVCVFERGPWLRGLVNVPNGAGMRCNARANLPVANGGELGANLGDEVGAERLTLPVVHVERDDGTEPVHHVRLVHRDASAHERRDVGADPGYEDTPANRKEGHARSKAHARSEAHARSKAQTAPTAGELSGGWLGSSRCTGGRRTCSVPRTLP